MKTKKIFLLTLCFSLFAVTACKKEEENPNQEEEQQEQTSQLGGYFTTNTDNEKQSFTIDASTSHTITGNKGTEIYIPANVFRYPDGSIANGTINIELIEILDVSDMVKNKKTTTSNGELLVSGGQIKLTATQNSTELKLNSSSSLWVSIPTTNPDPQMGLFTGIETADGDVDWTSASTDTSQTDTVNVWQDSTGTSYYNFPFNNDNLGWINCDYWWNSGNPKSTITADLSGNTNTHNYTNTSCFLVFPQINSVTNMYNSGNDSYFISNNIPINQQATFCCISEINGTYYSSFVTTTLSNNHSEVITMSQTTLNDINNAIANL